VEDSGTEQACRTLLGNLSTLKLRNALAQWREFAIRDQYTVKLQNAAAMVEKMSKFSRSYISINALSSIVLKGRHRLLSKAFNKWTKKPPQLVVGGNTAELEAKLA